MMVTNPTKFQAMLLGLGIGCKISIEIDKMVITTVDNVKLLGMIVDSKLKFDEHFKSLCLNANRNFSALSRIAKIVDPP